MKRLAPLAALFAAGCASGPGGSGWEQEAAWAGSHVSLFADVEKDPSTGSVSDDVAGHRMGLKKVTTGGMSVGVFILTPGDWTLDRDWEYKDLANVDITGLQVGWKW